MKKYVGLVRVEKVSMYGIDIKLYAMFANNQTVLYKWFSLYKSSRDTTVRTIVMENTPPINEFFEYFVAYTTISDQMNRESSLYDDKYDS